MKERERKVLVSLGSLGLVFLSVLGGRFLEGESKVAPKQVAHLIDEAPVLTFTPEFTPAPTRERTVLPMYTPMRTFTQPARERKTSTHILPTAQIIMLFLERTMTTVPLIELDGPTATQIISNATSVAIDKEE